MCIRDSVDTARTVNVSEVEGALADFELEDVKIQLQSRPDPTAPGGQQQEILVRSAHIDDQRTFTRVQTAIAEVAGRLDADGEPDVNAVSIEDVGPTWGRQVSSKALQGLIIFLVLVTLYITVRAVSTRRDVPPANSWPRFNSRPNRPTRLMSMTAPLMANHVRRRPTKSMPASPRAIWRQVGLTRTPPRRAQHRPSSASRGSVSAA